ncbi:MAG: hypothetical protein JW740_01745 [Candidatus Zambryskibacteria bacterium]|nr:hypothetical protein [Candidatus Zambryskibacteria bacterium]
MDGILRCSRYSFGPNRLHYCGPDANKELKDLIKEGDDDFGLTHLLKQFKTLYPYLKHIANANHIDDPFDSQVVEAYWIGNELLEKVEKNVLYRFFIDDLKVKDKIKLREFSWLEEKISQGAMPHHSFHVFNIWTKEGHHDLLSDLQRMDECRVSWGKVTAVNGPEIRISTEPMVCESGKFILGEPVIKSITRQLEAEYDIEQIKPGEIVSVHWSVPCEIITENQAKILKKYTLKNIAFANQTI